MVFTDTHLISFYYYLQRPFLFHNATVIQAFTLPPDGSPVENGNSTLRPTHEGVLHSVAPGNVEALKTSVDPITGTTTVKLLHCGEHEYHPQITHLDLTLPETSAVDLLPLTAEVRNVHFPNDGALENCHQTTSLYVDVSDDSQVRGYIREQLPRAYFYSKLGRIHDRVMKFTIDTTQNPWDTACGRSSPAEWNYVEDV